MDEEVEEGGVGIGTRDAFYNPRMELNRDITVAVLRAWRGRVGDDPSYLDAQTATGIRGVRAGSEAGYAPTLVDRSEDAVALARENLGRNGVDGDVVHEDANVVMLGGRYDVVDVDPFGTPVPFADAAFGSADSLACFTATDTAPLCGAHDSGVRRYSCRPLNTTYHAEMGLRVLVGALVRTAARHDVAATPVLSHSSDHYKRTYLALEEGARVADEALEGLGFVAHCFDCGRRSEHDAVAGSVPVAVHASDDCDCGGDREVAGPLWTDPVREPGFVDEVIDELNDRMGTKDRAEGTLGRLRDEVETATHYDQHEVCGRVGAAPYKIDETVERLRDAGYEASRTHYSGPSFKTDAPYEEITDRVGE